MQACGPAKNNKSNPVKKESSLSRTLEDGRILEIKSFNLTKGEADPSIIKGGVAGILDKMSDLYTTNIKLNNSQRLKGSVDYIFRIEPNGMFRMIQEGRRDVNEEHFAPLKEAFLLSAMSHEFKFPETGSQLVVAVTFNFK